MDATREKRSRGCYTRTVRRLIVNADDFGLTTGVNRGIMESHQRGIVTSTTLMATAIRFPEAVSLAKETPQLSVGCHVLLVDGTPVLNDHEIPTLLENSTHSFRVKLSSFARAAVTGKIDEQQMEAEITAQVRRLQSAGIEISHLDSHKHTHMFPAALRAMLRAAEKCGVHAIRNPFEPLVFAKFGTWKRSFQLRLLSRFRSNFRKALDRACMKTPDGCIGVAVTGGLTEQSFVQLIDGLPEGTWEFVSHPGYNDRELDQVRTRLRDSRDKEREILTSPGAKDALDRAGIQLISYREL